MAACVNELSRELRPPLTAEAALVEADRCLECGGAHAPAPCVVGCPADVDVPGFVAADRRGRSRERPRRSIFAENLLGGTCARVCPVEVLCQRRLRPRSTRDDRRSRSARSSATRPTWAYANGVPAARERPTRTAGASPSSAPAPPGSLRRRARRARLRRDGLRRARGGRRARPLRDRAVPADERAAARRGTAARANSGSSSGSARESTRRDLQKLVAEVDAIVLAVGMGADLDVGVRGRRPRRRLGVAALHREAEDRRAAGRRRARRRHRRRKHGDRRRGRGEAARRRRSRSSCTGARSTRCRPTSTRSSSLGTRASRSAFSRAPSGSSATDRVEGVRCAEMRLGAAGRDRSPPARARSGQRVHHSRRHRRQGDRPGAAR